MCRVTHFTVLSFNVGRKGRLFEESRRLASERAQAERLARRLSESRKGVVLLSLTGDPDLNDWDEPQIIATFGCVPEDFLQMS
ncbi:hypothetical protein [Blastochloris tepida]|uniref:Uncharacterized protein n=1 Tax=Blastochloris tepida TaxID=2233851 RepID=A0A348G1B7_9HYPH|nr:hypothetical protein [Blastochloris tepida]BBF93350.1 hypothetical protein BLTE_20350 [Blastochloris tepida]